MLKSKSKTYISINEKYAQQGINKALYETISNVHKEYKRIAVVGIGTDRSTGDSFGPLVGHMLSHFKIYDFDVYGTLREPVHALNIKEVIQKIDQKNTLIISVDASLGRPELVGYIGISNEPIKPGSGVGKDLPPIGDISISGVVTIGGVMPQILLQCVSLGLVYSMAEMTSLAIRYVLYKQQFEHKKIIC